MEDEKNTTLNIGEAAIQAEEQENTAKKEQDTSIYTHTFATPFECRGTSYEQLTFDFGRLTGADHLEIENELLMRGKTLVIPEYTGEFLLGMAVRACTERRPDGKHVLDIMAFKAMPMRDFQVICKRARSFLLRAGS